MEGTFNIRFSADGYEGVGEAIVSNGKIHGFDGYFHFTGEVHERQGGSLAGNIVVTIAPGKTGNSYINDDFSTQVSGRVRDEGFYVIGTGPLGIIVQIESTT